MEMKYPEIARRFRYIMDLRGYKAVDLSQRLNISAATISHYVNGNRCPSTDIALKLGEVLNCNPIWLMDLDDNMLTARKILHGETLNVEKHYNFKGSEQDKKQMESIISNIQALPDNRRKHILAYVEAMVIAARKEASENVDTTNE